MRLGKANTLHSKIEHTKSKKGLLIVGLFLLLNACYGGIPGKVVDAETRKPIEGAVVLVEWDITKGFGLSYTERYKVFETVTNEDGWFTLPGVLNPLVNPPNLAIYKKGYFAWREDYTFPDYKEKHFRWKGGQVFRLERFKKGYLYTDHTSFITSGIGSLGTSSKLYQAHRWERLLAQKELELYGKKLKKLPPDWKSYDQHTIEELQKQIWKEVAQELYFPKESLKEEERLKRKTDYPESKTPIMHGYRKSTGSNKEPVLQSN
jgi:hypothetical protein